MTKNVTVNLNLTAWPFGIEKGEYYTAMVTFTV